MMPSSFSMHECPSSLFFQVHRLKPSSDWRAKFNLYLRTMPAYYAGPLRRALTRMGAGNLAPGLIPETMDSCLSYQGRTDGWVVVNARSPSGLPARKFQCQISPIEYIFRGWLAFIFEGL